MFINKYYRDRMYIIKKSGVERERCSSKREED